MEKINSVSCPVFNNRFKMYGYIQNNHIISEDIDYLEFGVTGNASIKYWACINQNTGSRFYGFDSFSNIPELKQNIESKGAYLNNEDSRITFQNGIFHETLTPFLENYTPSNKQLVINNYSDKYTSTIHLLTRLNSIIKPGTILFFDEFASALHEFDENEGYITSFKKRYMVVAVVDDIYRHIAVQITN